MKSRPLPLAVLVALALAGCAGAPANPDMRARSDVLLPAYGMHEECMRLDPGDRLDYHFRSTAPVAFNIHYHEAGAVVTPLARDSVSADSGIYLPVLSHDFCLVWEAGPARATLEYQVGVRRRAAH